jgi:hypothetical protein
MTTITVEIPDDTDRSAKALRMEIWFRSLLTGCGSWVVLLENQDDSLNGVFSAQDTVDLKINNANFMKGYVDTVKHVVYDREDIFLHLLRISGRDTSQDMQNVTQTKSYPVNTRIDDLIEDAISDAEAEIIYNSSSTESQIAGGYEAKDDFLGNICRDVMERETYEGYVNSYNKTLLLYSMASLYDSGITLKSVAGASDNNILAHQPIEYTETDGTPIKNYIKIKGQNVTDGWTDDNSSDWTGGTNTAVSDDTGNVKAGHSSIKGTLTYDGVHYNQFWLDFSAGLYSKIANYLDWSIYGSQEMMWWARTYNPGVAVYHVRAVLQDRTGNVISYGTDELELNGMIDNIWYWLGAPIGLDNKIAGGDPDQWEWDTNIDGNFTWQIKKLGFRSSVEGTADDNYPQYMWIDDMRLPEQMVSITEDAGGGSSQALYRKRVLVDTRTYFILQKELDDYAAAVKATLKDPTSYIKLWAVGTAGCAPGGTNKWLPAAKATVNIPRLGINSETYRFVSTHVIAEPKKDLDGFGHDFIVECDLIPETAPMIGIIYDALSSNNLGPVVAGVDGRVRSLEKAPL